MTFYRILECSKCGRRRKLDPPDKKPLVHFPRVFYPYHPGRQCGYGRRAGQKCQGKLLLISCTKEEYKRTTPC